ncbi:MAG: HEAT repeat domain-containing protein [Gemmataceae bacterium]
MSTRSRLAAAVSLLICAAALAVAPPPRPLGTAQLQHLVDQLGDRDFRLREQAERRLYEEGLPALPLLRRALGHRDPEVRRRALRLVPGLEHAAFVAPRRVSYTGQNQPLRVVLDAISKQTGYKLMSMNNGVVFQPVGIAPAPGRAAPAPPGEPTYSFSFVNTPFWDAIDEICQAANLVVQQGWGDEIVRLNPGTLPAHVGRDGAFRYMATSLQMYRTVDLQSGGPGRNETLTFNFTLFSEPRLPFLGMGDVRVEAAYDSERNSMLPAANPNQDPMWGGIGFSRRHYNGGYKQQNLTVGVQLVRVSEKATALKHLRGVVPVTLLVETKPVVIADKVLDAKGKKTPVGDMEFAIETVQKMPNNQYQIKFTATNKAGANDYTWMNTLYQRVELQDEAGNKYPNWGTNWHGGGGNNVTLTLTYNGANANVKLGPPARFVYQHWVTRQHDIAFEFRNVPLP